MTGSGIHFEHGDASLNSPDKTDYTTPAHRRTSAIQAWTLLAELLNAHSLSPLEARAVSGHTVEDVTSLEYRTPTVEVRWTVVDPSPPPQQSGRPRLVGLGVFAATLLLLVATEPRLSIVWDEGYTLGREARVRDWFRALRDPETFAKTWSPPAREMVHDGVVRPRPEQLNARSKLFLRHPLTYFWPFAREEPHGHPPFYAIVGMIGDVLVPFKAILPRARFGPMLIFSLTAGWIYAFMARRRGPWAAATAAGAYVLQPRLFAHAHYAAYDALLTSLWICAILSFARAVEPSDADQPSRRWPRWGWVVLFGLFCGFAADTKLTGWFLPLPFIVWAAIYRDLKAVLTLVVGGVIGAITLVAFNPPWWPDVIEGINLFLGSNLTRDLTAPIQVQYLGKLYRTPNVSLPWHNTIVWTIFVTPIGFLLFALFGVIRGIGRSKTEPFGLLVIGHWAFMLALRAMPHTPGHDGERLFLPAFGILSLAAGLGTVTVMRWFGQRFGKAMVLLSFAEASVSLALFMPTPLSYYSPIVGGLPGATSLGMEATYYWDSLDRDTINWLNEHTPPGAKIKFATEPTSWMYLQQNGILKRDCYSYQPGYYVWYVVQNRPGNLSVVDRALVKNMKPVRTVSKQGVPLLWVFSYDDVIAQQELLKNRGGSR